MTTRRTAITALLGLGSGTAVGGTTLNWDAWRAFESIEEAWIRDRHALLTEQCPSCSAAAHIDLELKLAELRRRAMQFQHLRRHHPYFLRGGMWQLAALPMTNSDLTELLDENQEYRDNEELIRKRTEQLRKRSDYEEFLAAQTRLWKTPDYRSVHRRYSSRLNELNKAYGSVTGTD
jgi:hypothetical protein